MNKLMMVVAGSVSALTFAAVSNPAAARHASSYAEDRAEIQDLEGRYMFAMDWKDADAYAATFTEDGELDSAAATAKGRPAIRAFIRREIDRAAQRAADDKSGKRPPHMRHNITNLVLEVHGDHAISKAYWTEFDNNGDDRKPVVGSFGHYEDVLVKQNGHWLFARRHIFNEMLAAHAASDINPSPK
jgi:ketosteroid isomerase-like protein